MASRKEQKAALRREREARAREASAAQRRRRLLGYGAGGVLSVAALAGVVVALSSGGGGGGGGGQGLPSGGKAPAQQITDLQAAAKAAGCRLASFPGRPPEHTTNPNERISYNSNPPTNGKHFQEPVNDGAYGKDPGLIRVVHALEHGRVIWWFKPTVSERTKAELKALFDEDSSQLILTPYAPRMPYAVAASAWNGDPRPNGTGRLLGCPRANERIFDALRAFRDRHRGKGLEPVP